MIEIELTKQPDGKWRFETPEEKFAKMQQQAFNAAKAFNEKGSSPDIGDAMAYTFATQGRSQGKTFSAKAERLRRESMFKTGMDWAARPDMSAFNTRTT